MPRPGRSATPLPTRYIPMSSRYVPGEPIRRPPWRPWRLVRNVSARGADGPASELAEQHPLDGVVRGLLEHEGRAVLGRPHVLLEVRQVDVVPEAERHLDGLVVAQVRVDVEERARVAARAPAQREEAID